MRNAIERLRDEGWTPARLAAELTIIDPHAPITRQAITQWTQVPHDRVIAVERATGIPRHDLRPDLAAIFVPTGDRAA